MTGPEHYRQAERLVELAVRDRGTEDADMHVRAAQVHATLALAAATALTGPLAATARDMKSWVEVAS